jgi:hypothetical protein
MHQCNTDVDPKLYDEGCEAKLNFVNLCLQVVYVRSSY